MSFASRRKLLPLHYIGNGVWTQTAQMPFKPRGLMIWDAPPRTTVAHVVIGIGLEMVSSLGPVPARWFMMADSYEQIAKQLDAGKEPPGWNDWSQLEVGQAIRVTLELEKKPLDESAAQLVFWGEELVPFTRYSSRRASSPFEPLPIDAEEEP